MHQKWCLVRRRYGRRLALTDACSLIFFQPLKPMGPSQLCGRQHVCYRSEVSRLLLESSCQISVVSGLHVTLCILMLCMLRTRYRYVVSAVTRACDYRCYFAATAAAAALMIALCIGVALYSCCCYCCSCCWALLRYYERTPRYYCVREAHTQITLVSPPLGTVLTSIINCFQFDFIYFW